MTAPPCAPSPLLTGSLTVTINHKVRHAGLREGTIANLALGLAVRHEWLLDPDWLTVNHGSFGATPRVVLQAQERWRRRMEAQPSHFIRRVLPSALRDAAAALGTLIGSEGHDIAFLENATPRHDRRGHSRGAGRWPVDLHQDRGARSHHLSKCAAI